MLSDAAFKLYVLLCLNVDRHSARMVWEAMELANLLHRDRQSVADALEELCRREVCIRHPDVDGRIAPDRVSVEICDRFWPYEKPPVEEFGIDQNGYVQRVREMLVRPACLRVNFSAADQRLAANLYRRGVTLVHIQRAIWLGCARPRRNSHLARGRLFQFSLHDKTPLFAIRSVDFSCFSIVAGEDSPKSDL